MPTGNPTKDRDIEPNQSATSGPTEPQVQPPPRTKKSRILKHRDQEAATTTTTLRHPPYLYIRLRLLSPAPSSHTNTPTTTTLDALTLHTHLHSALTSYLGLHGSAIADSIDILHISPATNTAIVRVAYQDGTAVMAGIAAWAGSSGGEKLGIEGSGVWLGGLLGKGGQGGRGGGGGRLWSLES